MEGLAEKIKSNRGYRNLVQNITDDKSGDYAKQIVELGQAFKGMSSERAVATANMLGISSTLRQSLMNPEFTQFEKEYSDKATAMGVDLEKAAADGKSLTQALRGVRTTLDLIVDAAATPLFQKLDGPIRQLNDFLTLHGKEIAAIIGEIAAALLRITTYVLESLPAIDRFAKSLGGWETVFAGLAAVISAAFIGRLASLVGSLRAITMLGAMPPWLAAIGGLTALGLTPDAHTGGDAESAGHALGAEPSKQGAAIDSMSPGDRTKYLWKHRPKWLGGEGLPSGIDAIHMRGQKAAEARKVAAPR